MGPRQRKILIVEDDGDLLDVLSSFLVSRGYCVITATNGTEALEKFRAAEFDVVISDVQMPNGDGLGLLAAIQKYGRHVPVIMMTGGDHLDEDQATHLGAQMLLKKPFSLKTLVGSIEGLIHQNISA